jgi:hypothetical protein
MVPLALASEGVFEINQTCATETGCFAGDSPGYPVTIASSGAYRLTSNLRTSDATDVAVRINVNNVDLDLGGFGISCSIFSFPFTFTPCSASPNSTGNGVESSSPVSGVRLHHGSVSRMAADGISLHDAHVSAVTARENGVHGIVLSGRGIIENSVASENGANGIQTTGGSIQGNIVNGNAEVGLFLDSLTGYRDNTVTLNAIAEVIGGNNLGGNLCNFGLCP